MDAESVSYRYERKFLVPAGNAASLPLRIRLNPGRFSPLFQPRTVNNIYLDTPALRFYFLNVDGAADRTKVRIRWYGELFGRVEWPVLEFKFKHGLVGSKESYPLPPFKFEPGFSGLLLRQVLAAADLPNVARQRLSGLEPALVNHYQRAYFASPDERYRITVDSNLAFRRVRPARNSFLCRSPKYDGRVLELKYDHAHWQGADEIVNALPFRLTRMSKYVFGLDCLDGY